MGKAAAMTGVDFWYEFASTYSYPAAMRIEALAHQRGVAVRWRPFLVAPIFAAQGWRDSPFNIYAAKGRYMWRDMERICARLGLPLHRPQPFPQNSLLAARVALALAQDKRPAFSRAVYAAEFGEGRQIGQREDIAALLESVGESSATVLERALSVENKEALKGESATAASLDLPGAPCVVTADGEVFWGNDRIEEALDWARGRGGPTGAAADA
jgi:2-hydroxychromene-2-carboxylate isomerase